MTSDKKRREPDDAPAAEAGGLRFEAPLAGVPFGYSQDGGIVTARDAVTGQLVWTQRVYAVTYGGDIEDDKQDVFITGLELSADGRALMVENEHGERFCVSLLDRSVKQVAASA